MEEKAWQANKGIAINGLRQENVTMVTAALLLTIPKRLKQKPSPKQDQRKPGATLREEDPLLPVEKEEENEEIPGPNPKTEGNLPPARQINRFVVFTWKINAPMEPSVISGIRLNVNFGRKDPVKLEANVVSSTQERPYLQQEVTPRKNLRPRPKEKQRKQQKPNQAALNLQKQ